MGKHDKWLIRQSTTGMGHMQTIISHLSYGLCVTTGGTSEGSNIGAGADLWVECCPWTTMQSGAWPRVTCCGVLYKAAAVCRRGVKASSLTNTRVRYYYKYRYTLRVGLRLMIWNFFYLELISSYDKLNINNYRQDAGPATANVPVSPSWDFESIWFLVLTRTGGS